MNYLGCHSNLMDGPHVRIGVPTGWMRGSPIISISKMVVLVALLTVVVAVCNTLMFLLEISMLLSLLTVVFTKQ